MATINMQLVLQLVFVILGALALAAPHCAAQAVATNGTEALTQKILPPGCNNTAQLVSPFLFLF
jgi:hypothetical protein